MSVRQNSVSAPRIAVLNKKRSRSIWVESWYAFCRHRPALISLIVLVCIIIGLLIGPSLIAYDPNRINFPTKDLPPSLAHPMGTDELGRDQLVRILVGGRLTLAVATASVFASLTLGIMIGATAGYVGGAVDNVLMRIVDVFYSLPTLIVVILLVTMVGTSFATIVFAIAVLSWMTTARLVRASFLSLKQRDYVEAARSIGAGHLHIAVRHILVNSLTPIIVTATLGIAYAILTESALSFLGLGFQPPEATWGRMLQEAQRAVITQGHWWRGLFPGLFIFITVLTVNLVGDGFRDALDPYKRKV